MNKRLMIGQFGGFDMNKYTRDYRDSFFGIEACLMGTEEGINTLVNLSEKDDYNIGIHFPLRSNRWKFRDPQYMSQSKETKSQSLDYISEELKYIKSINPEYVLLHYPKPVVLDNRVDWANWRFADESEFVCESTMDYEEFKQESIEFFRWINTLAEETNINIVLELDAINRYIYETDLLESLLEEYPRIKLCLDLGRLHLQDKLDANFDSFEIAKRYAEYVKVVHIWNVKVDSNVTNSHYPALPNLSIEDGWADIEKYIRIVNDRNKECKYLFEHNSSIISDDQLEQCYSWIEAMIRGD